MAPLPPELSERRRLGTPRFSLIEILVVIGLIAFLTAAIVAVIPRVANASKVAATKATIKKVDEMLNDRINGFRRFIQKQDQQAGSGTPAYVLQAQSASGSTILTPGTNLAAAKGHRDQKRLFKMYFAQTYSELDPTTQNANPRGGSHLPITDSAECLYLIIAKGPAVRHRTAELADLKAIETADTDGDGIPEIVDAWGQPLRYYRWPTRLVRPAAFSPINPPLAPPVSPPASLANPGPIDEIYQPSALAAPAFVPPSPLTLAMVGAVPRPSLPVWAGNTQYSLGAKVVSGNTTPGSSSAVIYQCVSQGTSGAGPASPFGTVAQVIGTTIADNTVAWQVLVDPLSLDPDDPFGIATSFISETPSASSPLPPLTPNTWSVPLIVSCGGAGCSPILYEPYDSANFGTLAQPQLSPVTAATPHVPTDPSGFNRDPMLDNITNHQTMIQEPKTLPRYISSERPSVAPAQRASFTLLELLISLRIILILATLTMRLLNATLNSDRLKSGARVAIVASRGARDRAIHAGQPQGVRFIADPTNPSAIRSFAFVGSANNFTDGAALTIDGVGNVIGPVGTVPVGLPLPTPLPLWDNL